MKINTTPCLFWSIVGTIFTIVGSAAPAPTRYVGPIDITHTILSPIPIKIRHPAVTPVIHKRDFPIAIVLKEPESKSVDDVELSKRRAMVYGKVEFVGHPKYYTRDLPPTASPDDEKPQH